MKGSSPGCVSGNGPYAGGKLTVLVYNGKIGQTLDVSYRRAGTEEVIPLVGEAAAGVFLLEGGPPTSLPIESEETLPIELGFKVEEGEAPSAIDGTLLIEATGTPPISLPISGERRSFAGISVTPSTVTTSTDHRRTTVVLEGSELAEYLNVFGDGELPVTLYGPAGHTAEGTLALPNARTVEAEAGGGRAKAAITVESGGDAGKYAGKLKLPDLSGDGGSLSIEFNDHKCFLKLVLLVLAGVAFIGIGTRLVTTGTRRKLLETVLEQTYDVFALMVHTGQVAAWRLDDLMGETPERLDDAEKKKQRRSDPANGRLQGLPALRYSIANARSSKDLDEDAARVLDMVARMQRWLRVEPLARRLEKVEEKRTPSTELPAINQYKAKLAWSDSKTLRDTRLLLKMVKREPATAKEADELVSRLLFQIDWHNRLAAAWDEFDGKIAERREVRALDEALGEKSTVEERKPGEQDVLTARLDALVSKLNGESISNPLCIDDEKLTPEAEKLGITKVEWEASADMFTGWATLDEPSYDQLTRRVATSSRGLSTPCLPDICHEFRLLKLPDLYWSVAIAAFASAAYSVGAYNDTWGSYTDFATAFLAGSLGKVAINWAALPIFQSIRLRKAASG